MAQHGKRTRVAIGGHNLTRYFNDASVNDSTETADTTTFEPPGDSKTYIPGLNEGTISASGFYEGEGADSLDERLRGIIDESAAPHFVVDPGGGQRPAFGQSVFTTYDVSAPIGDAVTVSLDFQSDGPLRRGPMLAHTDSHDATSSTAYDTVDMSTASDAAYLQAHVFANDADDAVTFTLEHSADEATWLEGPQVVVPAGDTGVFTDDEIDTINRYWRLVPSSSATEGTLSVMIAASR